MNRLTEHDDQGKWCLKGVAWNQLHTGQVITKEVWEKLYGALWKLKDYEDTGLTPEEVERVNDFERSETGKLLKALGEEQKKHRWIPVSEKLPKTETSVLATVWHKRWIADYDSGNEEWWTEHPEYYEVCMLHRDGNDYIKLDDSDYDNINRIPVMPQEENLAVPIEVVTAWMPLPEAYREEDE